MRRVAQYLSDRFKISAGQNENLPVLSDSPAVFAYLSNWMMMQGNTRNLHLFSVCGE